MAVARWRSALASAALVVALPVVVPVVVPVVAAAVSIGGAATVERGAERGDAKRVTGTTSCDRVIVIGDSLTDNAGPWTRSGLRDAGYEAFVDAQPSRRIPASVRAPYSGVRAALAARATFGEADCWLVALGSNDLVMGADEAETASALVHEMLDATTDGATVYWVNVNYHRDPRVSFDFPRATAVFNGLVDAIAATNDRVVVVDWFTYSEANRQWFFDPVHVDRAGSIARAAFTVGALAPAP